MRRPVLAAVTALVVLPGVGGCQPRADASRPVHCSVIGASPDRDDRTAPRHIVAAAHFWCDSPGADEMTLTVSLQRQTGAKWTAVTSKTFTGRGVETTRPKTVSYREWTVSVPCAAGDFRTVVTGSSVSLKVTKTYDYTGPRTHDPCQPTIFSAPLSAPIMTYRS
jgi:hypothetical protein